MKYLLVCFFGFFSVVALAVPVPVGDVVVLVVGMLQPVILIGTACLGVYVATIGFVYVRAVLMDDVPEIYGESDLNIVFARSRGTSDGLNSGLEVGYGGRGGDVDPFPTLYAENDGENDVDESADPVRWVG